MPRTRSQKAELQQQGAAASPLQQLPTTTRTRHQPRGRKNKSNSLPPNPSAQNAQHAERQPKATRAQQRQRPEENVENTSMAPSTEEGNDESREGPSSLTIPVAHPVQGLPSPTCSVPAEAAPLEMSTHRRSRRNARSSVKVTISSQERTPPTSPDPSVTDSAPGIDDNLPDHSEAGSEQETPVLEPSEAASDQERPSVSHPHVSPTDPGSLSTPHSSPQPPGLTPAVAETTETLVELDAPAELVVEPQNNTETLYALIHLKMSAPATNKLRLTYPEGMADAAFVVPTGSTPHLLAVFSNVLGAKVVRNPLTTLYTDAKQTSSVNSPLKRKLEAEAEMPQPRRPRIDGNGDDFVRQMRLRKRLKQIRENLPRDKSQADQGGLPIEPLGIGIGAVRARGYARDGSMELGVTQKIHTDPDTGIVNTEGESVTNDLTIATSSETPTPVTAMQDVESAYDHPDTLGEMQVEPLQPAVDTVVHLPQTPLRSWGLSSILGTARSIGRYLPGRRHNGSQAPARSIVMAPTDQVIVASAPPVRINRDQGPAGPKLLRDRKTLEALKQKKAMRDDLEEQRKQLEKEREWLAKERRDVERAHRAAYDAQKPGEKRARLPSPEVIPRNADGGFTTDSNYFAYDSSDEGDTESSPTQPRRLKAARLDTTALPSTEVAVGEPDKPRPYTGRHFLEARPNAFKASNAGRYWDEIENQRSKDAKKQKEEAEKADKERKDPKPAFYVPGWGIGGDTSSSEDEDENDEEVVAEQAKIGGSTSSQQQEAKANAKQPLKESAAGPEHLGKPSVASSTPLVVSASASSSVPTTSSAPRTASEPVVATAPITDPAQVSKTPVTSHTTKTQNTWTQPPPPPPNPSHAALPEPDSIRIQRAKFQKLPTKPSFLRYSSRISTSTVGSEDGNADQVDAETAGSQKHTAVEAENNARVLERESISSDSFRIRDSAAKSSVLSAYEDYKTRMDAKVTDFLESTWEKSDADFSASEFSHLYEDSSADRDISVNDSENSLFLPIGPSVTATAQVTTDSHTNSAHVQPSTLNQSVETRLNDAWNEADMHWAIDHFKQNFMAFKNATGTASMTA
ncbi:MAG: hypothetical protein Q9190_003040 [Brigantiaea leucoxantha]